MADDHPSFANPTIVETLCEIRFSPASGEPRPYAGEFFKRIQSDFPDIEPVVLGMQVQPDADGFGQRLAPQQRLRFKHREKPLFLQLGVDALVVNLLPKYPGWASMRAEVLAAWDHAYRVHGQGTMIHRIGLRYINRIPRNDPSERPEAWLRSTDMIPAAALRSEPGFLVRVEVQRGGATILTLGDERPGPSSAGAIVLDIDRVMPMLVANFTPEPDLKSLSGTLDRLHQEVWAVFDAARTDQLTALLAGGPK